VKADASNHRICACFELIISAGLRKIVHGYCSYQCVHLTVLQKVSLLFDLALLVVFGSERGFVYSYDNGFPDVYNMVLGWVSYALEILLSLVSM
jgi:hypothetical protein